MIKTLEILINTELLLCFFLINNSNVVEQRKAFVWNRLKKLVPI